MGADNHVTVVPTNHDGDNDTDGQDTNDSDITPNYGVLQ